ncbi:uncharacterized protein MONOS_14348 [Monocercomonoides exilis]|uniref:uncharacterized protein n=1 Tax=Monocercomonoides exilis TaxID=2049356 RepID=UPI00355A66C0|nr:hypothetical protein MONOS_14348 [Monocercomonoides exilis]|eukprot:MONOS_14348.1-p1 / transcript=MONOS_14348.1 / gene=MONOS_14348 / organism=Monocercomonoides_exilis_PA203 / gene_product=unspecified product / transcript_product=unspecified product / location=Mono_scaffold00986:5476-6254(-) / protein_length=176 / sequence_SO=supercontig / SO=protein_coding / is_pseudo=false
MTLLVVEELGLSRLRFVKEDVDSDKQHAVEPEMCSSSSVDGIQQEISRAKDGAKDGSFGITSDGVGKDEEQVEISKKGLATNEKQGGKDSSIDLEKEGRADSGCGIDSFDAFEAGWRKQRETMDEFVASGEVVLQKSVPSIALWDATNAIRQECHKKGMIGVFGVLYCVFEDEWE